MISSGEDFLTGPEFNLGLLHNKDTGEPVYDTIAMAFMGYDAVNLGNHDIDFGPGHAWFAPAVRRVRVPAQQHHAGNCGHPVLLREPG
jgi:hypothetical protein